MTKTSDHYVPQFYLRRFARVRRQKKKRSDSRFLLWCFDKTARRAFESSPQSLAQETGYYDFVDEHGVQRSAEKFLSKVENRFEPALDDICSSPSVSTLRRKKRALAYFIALQSLRGPAERNEFVQMTHALSDKLGYGPAQLTEDNFRDTHVDILLDQTPRFADILVQMRWILLHNPTPTLFVTSDHPYNKYNPTTPGGVGLLRSGIVSLFPLSPRLAVLICDPVMYEHVAPEMILEPPDVLIQNRLQAIEARRFLYSFNSDFRFAEEVLEKAPETADPNRPRFISY